MLLNLCAGWQHYALDGVMVVLLLTLGFLDGKKGLIGCLFSLLSVLVATGFAFLFMNLLLQITGGLFGLQTVLEDACVRVFSGIQGFNFDVSNQGISAALADKNIPAFLIDAVLEEYGNATIPAGTTIASLVGTSLGGIIAGLISWVILFFIGQLILLLVKQFLTAIIERLPLIGKINYALGFAVGVIRGTLIVSAVLAIISIIPSTGIGEYLSQTLLLRGLYNHNPINEILSWILF